MATSYSSNRGFSSSSSSSAYPTNMRPPNGSPTDYSDHPSYGNHTNHNSRTRDSRGEPRGPGVNSTLNHQPPPAKLFQASVARRRAEQDAVLLQNRIALLRTEEERAKSKIAETTGKAAEIIDMRDRNAYKQWQQEQIRRQREEETEELKRELLDKKRKDEKRMMRKNRKEAEEKSQAYQQAVEDRRMAEAVLREDRELHRMEAEEVRARIRKGRITAQANAQKALEDKKRIAGQAFNEKLAREEAVRAEKEAMIKEMEREEIELIRRLQETQQRQQAAYEVLEDIVAQPAPTIEGGASVASSRNGRSNSKTLVQQEVNAKMRQLKKGSSTNPSANDSSSAMDEEYRPPGHSPPFPSTIQEETEEGDLFIPDGLGKLRGVSSNGNNGINGGRSGTRPNISPHSDVELGDGDDGDHGEGNGGGNVDEKLTYVTADGEAIEIDLGPQMDDLGELGELGEELELAASLNA